MSNRTERRAAEHAVRKLQHQVEKEMSRIAGTESRTVVEPAKAISEAQLSANRSNARRSTGPTTPEGRTKSSANALTHALTGKAVLLPTDDVAEYHRRLRVGVDTFQPATEEEDRLIQAIVDSYWRISRIQKLETGILLKGYIEFAETFNDQPEHRRGQLIETETYLKYERSFRNLQLQESRLIRRIEKDQAELTRLQNIRRRDEIPDAIEQVQRVSPPNGFEFSTPEIRQSLTSNPNLKPNARAA